MDIFDWTLEVSGYIGYFIMSVGSARLSEGLLPS
jgi:hypothetical protein